MELLNFTHPLTDTQQQQLEAITGKAPEMLTEVMAKFDPAQPMPPQAKELVDSLGWTPQRWQTSPLVVNLPAFAAFAAAVLAELHGRMGYFPPVLRMRAVPDSLPPVYELAEILNLQAIRDQARTTR